MKYNEKYCNNQKIVYVPEIKLFQLYLKQPSASKAGSFNCMVLRMLFLTLMYYIQLRFYLYKMETYQTRRMKKKIECRMKYFDNIKKHKNIAYKFWNFF